MMEEAEERPRCPRDQNPVLDTYNPYDHMIHMLRALSLKLNCLSSLFIATVGDGDAYSGNELSAPQFYLLEVDFSARA